MRDKLGYARKSYGVPAKMGGKITYRGQKGVITGGSHYVKIRLEGENQSRNIHPQDPDLEYLQEET